MRDRKNFNLTKFLDTIEALNQEVKKKLDHHCEHLQAFYFLLFNY